MAKLQDFRDYHFRATAQVSNNTRTLALAAVAIVWIFKTEVHNQYFVPDDLKHPLFLVILALGFDFLQYVYSSAAWYFVFRNKESLLHNNQITETTELYITNWVNSPSYLLFIAKSVVLIVAYVELGAALLRIIK